MLAAALFACDANLTKNDMLPAGHNRPETRKMPLKRDILSVTGHQASLSANNLVVVVLYCSWGQ
jgi:hypothetical protein